MPEAYLIGNDRTREAADVSEGSGFEIFGIHYLKKFLKNLKDVIECHSEV